MSVRFPILAGCVVAFGMATGCAVEEEEGFVDVEMRCAKPPTSPGCVRTQIYWKTHNVYASATSDRTAWPISENMRACGASWYEWSIEPQEDADAWLILAQQFIAAMLNKHSGAAVPLEAKNAINSAVGLLMPCEVAVKDEAKAWAVAKVLYDYNTGRLGVPKCQ
jgi:hypothetical protein